MGKSISPGVIVSIGNQKGGVGKSVITSLAANYINEKYAKKLKIVVVDGDDLQSSLYNLRQDEIQFLDEKKQKNLYRLLQISSADLPSQIELLRDEFDIVFIDLPGNLKQPGVITNYYLVDVLFVPTQTSRLDIDSSIKFIELIKDDVIRIRKTAGTTTDIYGIFSRVNPQNKDFKELYANKESYPIPFLENYVPESSVTFQRNVSTTEIYENSRYEEFEDICEEILEKILKFTQHDK